MLMNVCIKIAGVYVISVKIVCMLMDVCVVRIITGMYATRMGVEMQTGVWMHVIRVYMRVQ